MPRRSSRRKSVADVAPEAEAPPAAVVADDDDVDSEEERSEEEDAASSDSTADSDPVMEEGDDDDDDDDDAGSDDDGDDDAEIMSSDDERGEDTDEDAMDEEQEEESDSDDEERAAGAPRSSSAPAGEEGHTFDLRNLTALNPHQVDASALYRGAAGEELDVTISSNPKTCGTYVPPDESILMERARSGCTDLLRALWNVEKEKTDVGPLGVLPDKFVIATPRSLQPPAAKAETKWEKFAKERGIAPKEKRERKVWDESTGTWMYRHGYQKGNDSNKEWPIMEVGRNDDPYDDPWEKARDEKRTRGEKNTANRMRNQERAGTLTKGTGNRHIKDKKKAREAVRGGGGPRPTPGGIPVDLSASKKRGKELTSAALLATQRSTASLGKFDKMREGEPERKKAMTAASRNKRKYESSTDQSVVRTESARGMKVLDSVMTGGGMTRQRAIKRGEFAKGETAYDYDYEDGLGAGNFKKKKGRAGAGKMKKMTKKRAK